MCKIWGAPFTLAAICFSCIWFHTESLFLHLPVPLSLSSFFLILLMPFYALFHQMSTLKCQLPPPLFRLSMKLWEEEEVEHIGGFVFFPPPRLSFTWIFVCLSLSRSVSLLLFLSRSFVLSILSLSPVTSLSFTLSLSILVQLSAVSMKAWLM